MVITMPKQIHNQLDIIKRLDELIAQSEREVDELLGKRLKEILATLSNMYSKFVKSDESSYTDLNKYNRLSKELERIAQQLNTDYTQIVKDIEASQQRIYVEQYLLAAYLFQVYQGTEDGFTLPSEDVIAAALVNPIEFLQLRGVLEVHRNEIIRKIQIEVSQSLLAGEGYWKMAKRIENAVGFSQNRARTVARTEGARAMSLADEAVTEEMRKYTDIECLWLSTLDKRTRHQHRKLDGQRADKEGYFHFKGMKAKGPTMWNVAHMDINCRCVKIKLIDGQLPGVRRGRDYKDAKYQKRLADKIDEYMEKGHTYAKAYQKADEEIQPPNKVTPYITYEEWERKQKGT